MVLAGVIFASPGFAPPASAQIEEIIVTAQKREQAIQDVPIAIAVASDAALEANRIYTIYTLQSVVPALQVQSVESPGMGTALAVRGVGSPVFNIGFDAAVATFVDGIYRSRSGLVASADYLDIERIEVLKGPQGTLFGRNSSAGLVHMISRAPDFAGVSGEAEASVEEYDRVRVKGAINVPASDRVAFRLAANYAEGDGWMDVVGSGDEIHDLDRWAVKAQMLARPGEDLTIRLIADYAQANENCCAPMRWRNDPNTAAINGPLAAAMGSGIVDPPDLDNLLVDSNRPPDFEAEDRGLVLDVNWDVAGLTLTSLTGYRDYEDSYFKDNDFTGVDMLPSPQDLPEVSLWSEELRLAGESDLGGRRLSWLVGGYYSDETIEVDVDFIWGSQINNLQVFGPIIAPGTAFEMDFDQDLRSYAAFGHATYELGEALSLTLGARWSWDDKDGTLVNTIPLLNNAGGPNSLPFPVTYDYDASYDDDEPTYTASLHYRVIPDVMAYVTYSTGYKSGGISMQRDAAGRALFLGSPVPPACPPGATQVNPFFCSGPPHDPTIDKETSAQLEVGVKSDLMEGRLRLNAAAWHSSFEDLQQQTLRTDGSFAVVNVAGATSQGVEFEPAWAIHENLTVALAIQYLDAEFDDGVPALQPGYPPLGGEQLPFASDWTGNLSLSYRRPLGTGWRFFTDANLYVRSEYTNSTDPAPELEQTGFALLNLQAGAGIGNWEISAWCRNCTDEIYTWSNFQIPFDGAILFPPGAGPDVGTRWAHVAEPRLYGMTVLYRFGAGRSPASNP